MRIIQNNSTFKDYQCIKEWPLDCFVQGGSDGVVVSKKGNYMTAYFEAFPKNPECFIRGEGSTLEEAETNAYNKFMKFSNCKNHKFEKLSSYKNGMGKCKNCGLMIIAFEPDYTCIVCKKHECYSGILPKYRTTDNDCICKECFMKKENFHYLEDRSIQMQCNHFNGSFFTHKAMDDETFEKLKNCPNSLDEFIEILKKDSNPFLLEYIKRLMHENQLGRSYPTLNDIYSYFYENFMERWIKRETQPK